MSLETARLFEQYQRSLRENGDVVPVHLLIGEAATELLGEKVESATGKISKSHLAKINKWSRSEIDEDRLHVFPTLMITEAPTRNLVIYTAVSQKKSAKAWEGVPVLFNANAEGGFFGGGDHALKANSQVGRLYQAQAVKTPNGDVGTLGWWYAVEGISEELDAVIQKCETGIHREGSIHVTVPMGVECSICNDAFSKCNENAGTYHYPGEKYKVGKKEVMCYMSTGTGVLGPLEYSLVACPGSTAAHIMGDDEVANYSPVNLREALGGSREAIDTIIPPRQENTVDKTALRNKLIEAAKAAGVSLREFVADEANKEQVAAADVKTETLAEAFPDVDLDEGKKKTTEDEDENDDEDETKEDKNPVALFEGDCPVCLRGPSTAESLPADEAEATKLLREKFQQQVQVIIDKAKEKVDAAETAKTEAEKKATDFAALLEYLVNDTVTLAIDRGHKQSADREAYREQLASLPFEGVKEIREALNLASKPTAEAQRENVIKKLEERAKLNVGQTTAKKTDSGRTVPTTGHKPRFGAATK